METKNNNIADGYKIIVVFDCIVHETVEVIRLQF